MSKFFGSFKPIVLQKKGFLFFGQDINQIIFFGLDF